MKTTKKNGPLPFIYAQTPREKSTNPLLTKEDIYSLQEFENNESHIKTQVTERKHGEMNLGISHFLNSNNSDIINSYSKGNYSNPDMFAPMSFSSIRMTPKTIKAITVKKKTERREKMTLLEQISELKVLLHKYRPPETQIIIPSRLDVKKTIQCLESLSDVDSNMKDIMDLIVKVLKGAVYVNPNILERYNEDIMSSDHEELKKIFMSSEQTYVPYFTLSCVLLNALTKQEGKRIDYTKQLESKVEELTQEINAKEEMILNLQEKLQTAITKDVYSQIIEELRSARERASAYFEENKRLNIHIEELVDDNNQLNRQYEEECAEVEKRINHIKELEIEKVTLIEEGEIYIRKINESKSTITNLENTFNVITKRIEDMKKPFILLQERNDELMCENERLNALISANGTEALTPRPDYRTLQEEKKIELDIFDITGKSQVISTSVVIEELMKKIADLTQKNQEPSLKDGAKPINLTIANLNAKRGGNRSRAGSFNINSPLKPPKSNSLQESLNASPSPGGKSLFGRMAPRNPSQFGSGVSQFNPSPSQFAPNQSTTGRPGASLFGNTLNPTSIYDFKERTPTSDMGIKDDFSSLCPESIDNSPSDCKTDSNSTPKSSGKYILRIEIPKKRRNSGKEEALERADDLISYIARTKEDIENFVSNL